MTTTAVLPEHTQTKNFVSGVEVTTNLHVADTTRMSVDAHGAAHIMSLLTDLYSDPEGTVLREYISNGLDSHAAAGTSDPIQVSLPSRLSNNFIVQDFGTGMSAQEVREIYSSYGKSTKRTDFTQIGAYGLGCKSALTMVQSFTLVSVKDGEKTIAAISRGEDGVGEIKILKVSETDEPNGVRVTIPVSDTSKFLDKAKDFFFAIDPEKVLVDGQRIERSLYNSDFSLIDGTTTYISRQWGNTGSWRNAIHVVMGGVAYKITLNEISNMVSANTRRNLFWSTVNGYSVPFATYSVIPIASIDLTPSREEIRYSDRTRKFLALLIDQIAGKFVAHIQKDIETAPTHLEALVRYHHYNSLVRSSSYASNRLYDADIKWNGVLLRTAAFEVDHHRISIDYNDRTSLIHYGILDVGDLISRGRVDKTGAYVVVIPGVKPDPNATDKIKASKEAYDLNKSHLDKIRRNFTQFLRRNTNGAETVDSTADPIQKLYVFQDTIPTNPWFVGVGLFHVITEQDILDGAAKWRKDRRNISKTNNPSGTSTTPRNLAYRYLTLLEDPTDGLTLEIADIDPKSISKDDVYTTDDKVQRTSLRHIARFIESGAVGSKVGKDRIDRYSTVVSSIKALGLVNRRIIYVPSSRKVSTLFDRTGFSILNIEELRREIHRKKWEALSPDAKDYISGSDISKSVFTLLGSVVSYLKSNNLTLESLGDKSITRLWNASVEATAYVSEIDDLLYGSVHSSHTPVGVVDRAPSSVIRSLLQEFTKRYPLLGSLVTAYFAPKDFGAHYVLYINAVNESRKDN